MCAVLILGIGIAGLTQGLNAALRSTKESEQQTTAALLAAGQIEALRAEGYLTDGETEGDGEGSLSRYHWKMTVSGAGVDGLHEVVVTVQNSKSSQDIYELRTLLFEAPSYLDSTSKSSGSKSTESKSNRREGKRR